MNKFFENLQYLVLIGLILGQSLVGQNFYIGQSIYLLTNLISVIRTFALARPVSDKIKDCSCLAITISLILLEKFF